MAKKNKKEEKFGLVIYKDKKGNVELKADLTKDTIWATLNQIAFLFGVQKAGVSKHIKHIFSSGELSENRTVSKMETVQIEGGREIERNIEFYNLDMILSIGYRVNSKQATEFRKWATKTLREYLVRGYVLNEQRLSESKQNSIKELEKTIGFIKDVVLRRQLGQSEMESILGVIKDYAHSWSLLQKFDERDVSLAKGKVKSKILVYEDIRNAIDLLKTDLMRKGEAGDLFGNERGGEFQGILKTIYQTFGGSDLYPSVEEKAAHLLYFVIKDHSFSDGNKRIGSFLFIHFLSIHKILIRKDGGERGQRKINDNALVALALLIAESDPAEKEQIVALVTQLIK